MPIYTAVFDSIQFLNPVKHNWTVLKSFKYIDLEDAKFEATVSRNLLYYEYKSYDGQAQIF